MTWQPMYERRDGEGRVMATTRQPKTHAGRTSRRRVRVTAALGLPGYFRQVQYWDPIVCVWADFGDPVVGEDKAREKAARCERGEKP